MTLVNKNQDSEAKFKSSGTIRTIVLSCVQDIPENYWNLKIVFEKLKIDHFFAKKYIISDFKLINIVNGMQSSSSTYPCPYCKAKRPQNVVNGLKQKQEHLKVLSLIKKPGLSNQNPTDLC